MKWTKYLYASSFALLFTFCAYTLNVQANEDFTEEVSVIETSEVDFIEKTEEILTEINDISEQEIIEEISVKENCDLEKDSIEENLDENTEGIIEENITSPSGIQRVNDYYVIYGEQGAILKGMQIYQGHAYYLDTVTGAIQTGFVYSDNGNVYYCDEDGRIRTGEFTIGDVTIVTDKRGNILSSSLASVPYFSQKDSRWAYTTVGLGTIGATGCAMNVMTSIVNYFTGSNYTPVDIAKIMYNAGYYNRVVQGTLGSAWPYMASYFNLDIEFAYTVGNATQALKKGYIIAAGLGTSVFTNWYTTYTHEILFYGYNGDGTTNVYDPNNSSLNKSWTLDYLYSVPSWDPDDRVDGCSYFAIGNKNSTMNSDVSISSNKIGYAVADQYYTGYALEPEIIVTKVVNGVSKRLIEGKDYTIVGFYNNNGVGKGSALLLGNGHYTGSQYVYFNIIDNDSSQPEEPIVQILENGTYVISAGANAGYCLNNSYASKDANQEYIAYDRTGSNNQKYVITYVGDGLYTIKNVASDMYLSCNINPASTSDRLHINQSTTNTTKATQWYIKKVNGSYIICSSWNDNYVINIDCEELTGPREVIMYKYSSNDMYQKWNFERL